MCFKCAKMTSNQNPLCELYLVFTSNWFCWISLQALFDMRLSVGFCIGVGFAELSFIDVVLKTPVTISSESVFRKFPFLELKK